jgi:hypothetical protein
VLSPNDVTEIRPPIIVKVLTPAFWAFHTSPFQVYLSIAFYTPRGYLHDIRRPLDRFAPKSVPEKAASRHWRLALSGGSQKRSLARYPIVAADQLAFEIGARQSQMLPALDCEINNLPLGAISLSGRFGFEIQSAEGQSLYFSR